MGIPQNASAFETLILFPSTEALGGECRNTGAKHIPPPRPAQGMSDPKPGASLLFLEQLLPVSLLRAPCSWQPKVRKLPARSDSWGDEAEPGGSTTSAGETRAVTAG